jgi:predicted metal-dependent hydrolase
MELDYKLIYSKRKTIAVTVERDRSVVVRAPEGIDASEVRTAVAAKKLWIYEKLRHPQKYGKSVPAKEFVSGETVLYLGRSYRLEVQKGEEDIRFVGKFVVTGATRDRANSLFAKWYRARANEQISERVARHARNLGVQFNAVHVTDLKYRWGSCTPKNNLNFNWKLIQAPVFVIDYVIVHELAHLLEDNHTPRFWTIVKAQIPDYEKAKSWLRTHGELLDRSF